MFHDLFLFSFLRETEEKPGWCSDPHRPPCAGYEFFLLLFFLLLKFTIHTYLQAISIFSPLLLADLLRLWLRSSLEMHGGVCGI